MKKIINHLKENWIRYGFETFVIIVGILGAFTLNNWNENRKLFKEELNVLLALKSEFTTNQSLIDEAISNHKMIEDQAKELSEIIGPEIIDTDTERLNQLLNTMIWPPKYDPSDGVINAVISSGDLSLIKNDQLKYSISSLSGLLKDYYHWAEIDYNNLTNYTGPNIIKNYSFKNFPFAKALGQSKFENSPEQLMNSSEFESHITLRWVNAVGLKERAISIKEEQTKIIELINEELKSSNNLETGVN